MTSIFTQIVQGKLPCYSIYEDQDTLSFLSIAPINPGHTLVIPKREIDSYKDVPPELFQKVMGHCHSITWAVERASGKKRVCLAIQGFEVPHFHVHLIPCETARDFDFSLAHSLPPEEMVEMAKKIRNFINNPPSTR